jgi:hypothetical protein
LNLTGATIVRLKLVPRLIVSCCFVALAAGPANAQSVDDAAKTLASQIKQILLDNQLQASAAVDRFESPSGQYGTLGIQQRLQDELSKLSVETTSKDVSTVTGNVHLNEHQLSISGYVTIVATQLKISIADAQLVDPSTGVSLIDEQAKLSQQATAELKSTGRLTGDQKVAAVVQEREDVVAITAPTYEANLADVSPGQRLQSLKDEILYSTEEPEVCLSGSTISAYEGSHFSIELLTKDANGYFTQHPNVTSEGGNAFVHLKERDKVAIRVINNSGYDIGAKILIDGLNSFSFSTVANYRTLGLYSIERLNGRPASSFAYPITGWHIDNHRVHEFNVTTMPNSAARELQQEMPGKIGVISVLIFPSWKAGESPPAAELEGSTASRGRGLAMGKGDVTAAKYDEVKRLFGKTVVAAISVRYARP